MCTKADEAEIFRFLAFEGAGGDFPCSHGTLQPAQCLSQKLLASRHNIGVCVRSKKRQRKHGLATRSVSYNQETLPSFFLPLLVVTKVNILAEAEG